MLALFWHLYVLERDKSHKKPISILNKENFKMIIKTKTLSSLLKLNTPHTKPDNLIFDTFRALVILCTDNKKTNIFKNHKMNISIKFGSNWPSGFRAVDWKQTSLF